MLMAQEMDGEYGMEEDENEDMGEGEEEYEEEE